KWYRPSRETSSHTASPALPLRKRYRDSKDSKDKSIDSEGEEATSANQQQQVVLAEGIAEGEPLGLGYGVAIRQALEETVGRVHSTYEVGQISRSTPGQQSPTRMGLPTTWLDPGGVLPSSLVVPSPIASPVTTPTSTISVDEDQFLKVGSQLELHGNILHDHTHHLGAISHALFEGYDRDLKELYTRSREVRDEIFSQCYRLRSLRQGQERAIVTFSALWRPMLALEAWAG
nr:hypothetical protein [Tanacetum cinerariifolium]